MVSPLREEAKYQLAVQMLSTLAITAINTLQHNSSLANLKLPQLHKLQGHLYCVKTHYIFKTAGEQKGTCYFKEKKHSRTAKQWAGTKEQGFSLLVKNLLECVRWDVQSPALRKTTKTQNQTNKYEEHKANSLVWSYKSNNLLNLNFVSKRHLPSLAAQGLG